MRRSRILLALALLLLIVAAAAAGVGLYAWRRALPQIEGTLHAPGLAAPVEIVRDRWGVPHIFAASDADAYYALGWVMVQDRLFQLDLLRHAAQGRLAELFGRDALPLDRLFRTLDLPGSGRRMYAGVRPEVRAAGGAFTAGMNASLAELGTRLPPEYVLLRTVPDPFQPDDFAAVVGYLTWRLNPGWRMDPLYERIVAKVGPRLAAELFPQAAQEPLRTAGRSPDDPRNRDDPRSPIAPGGAEARRSPDTPRSPNAPGGTDGPRGPLPQPDRFRLSPAAQALLDALPQFTASNSWALAPARSASGHALLASDPHLGLGLPSTWYEAHLRTPQSEVIGAFLPGLPFAIIGHTRAIAWGLVNLDLDAGDFFLERLDAAHPGQVLFRGGWVALQERHELIHSKGGDTEALLVRSTPHGPLVNDVQPGAAQALSYRWVYAAAQDANEINGFYDLNRARDWAGFRAALSQFGAVAQSVTYADRRGHIGLQVSGRIPLRAGRRDGLGFREGWTGRDEWEGFLPFERNPSELDPASGTIAVANNPPAQEGEVYLSGYFEPQDRITRIRALLARKERHSIEDLERMQRDEVFVSGRVLAPQVIAAFASAPAAPGKSAAPPGAVRAALEALQGWDGAMTLESRAATVFAVFYKHLFHEIFADELGEELLAELRSQGGNASAVMIHAALQPGHASWLDRRATPALEDRAAIFRAAFSAAEAELVERLGEDPSRWQWGTLHQIEFAHPLGRVRALAPLFNVGPLPVPGHAQTIDKGQFHDGDFRVYLGPSLRQITDLGDPAHAWAILPGGQSGLPASPHYADLIPLWREGRYHPLLLERDELERLAEGRLVLTP